LTERKGARAVPGYTSAMRPRFYPTLVNDRFGDPAVFVDFLLERRAILFDLGDISALPTRSILRVSDIFVSHTHIDHFYGFDRLLRLLVGREKRVRLYGPAGFVDRVEAKLNAYTWNLTHRFQEELVFSVMELAGNGRARRVEFRFKSRFARGGEERFEVKDGVILDEPSIRVSFAALEHRTPSLAFALQEKEHVNVWRTEIDRLGLAVGPWLRDLKEAVHRDLPEDTLMAVTRSDGTPDRLPLGLLRARILSLTPGQKLAYVTDTAFTDATQKAITDLARDADILFIEAAFARSETAVAAERAHLTTAQAGQLARQAGAKRVEPFHFSPRYCGQEAMMFEEVNRAYLGEPRRG
jgi:ribonuclease Z